MASTDHSDAAPFQRVEDNALVRGAGRYVDDERQPGQVYGCFVRSPHAFAAVLGVDSSDAQKMPGVLGIFTAREMTAAGIGSIARHPPIKDRDGKARAVPDRPALAGDFVRHVGDPVALVVADCARAAQDAAEAVLVDYEERPSVVDARAAMHPDAPQLYPDIPNNVAVDWPGPVPSEENDRAVDRIFEAAAHVARATEVHQRLVIASMEPRGATAMFDAATERYTLRVCSQSAEIMRNGIAQIMGLDKSKLRVITEDVGGAFGLKTSPYPEYIALLVAAKVLGCPVHWMSTRSEAFLTDHQARDAVTDIELALDADGIFLGLRVHHIANQGAYVAPVGVQMNTWNFARCFPTVYDIPHIKIGVTSVLTNTVPIGPYRGAGRPEANYSLERVIEEAARITGVDAVELRKRNLIPPSKMPYRTAVGTTYDSGEFRVIMNKALSRADFATFARRKHEAAERGRLRGIGVSCFLEHAGAAPEESAAILFPGNETMQLVCNVQSTGQSHQTIFPRLLGEKLGIPASQIKHRHGDTDLGVTGFGSVGSRSAMVVSHTMIKAADALIEKGVRIASHLLEAAESDIAYRDGDFQVAGTDRRLTLFEVAARAGEIGDSLDTRAETSTPQTFPNGCHVAEVEIDPETGEVDIIAYTAVDDCGVVLDHTVVDGQVVGALAQGLGQVMLENCIYDDNGGQLIAGSFMDYAMPRATDMPHDIRADMHSVAATTNPMGVKGVGEAGTTGSLAAVMNAIADAIPNGAGHQLQMPATPAKIWAAIRKSESD